MSKLHQGTVVMFKERPGYGFIRTDGGEIFFHHQYLQMPGYKTVKPDTLVEFEMGENHQGPMAIKIRVLRLPDGSVPDYEDKDDSGT